MVEYHELLEAAEAFGGGVRVPCGRASGHIYCGGATIQTSHRPKWLDKNPSWWVVWGAASKNDDISNQSYCLRVLVIRRSSGGNKTISFVFALKRNISLEA